MISLATLASATLQEVADQVTTHLLTQMDRAVVDGVCLYRTEDGLACAAGCLMTDSEFEELKLKGLRSTTWSHIVGSNGVPTVFRMEIIHLQYIHDCHPVNDWSSHLVQFYIRYNLIMPNILKEKFNGD